MGTTWQYEDTGEYLAVRVTGAYRAGNMNASRVEEIALQARTFQRWRVLIDLTAMQGSMPNTDRFLLGEAAGRFWGRRLKVAVAARPGTVNRFFENVAVNSGANVRAFEDIQPAIDWLLHGGLTHTSE